MKSEAMLAAIRVDLKINSFILASGPTLALITARVQVKDVYSVWRTWWLGGCQRKKLD